MGLSNVLLASSSLSSISHSDNNDINLLSLSYYYNASVSTVLPSVESTKSTECDAADDDCYTPYVNRPETYIVPVVFAIIFVVGVVGNGTLVIIFLRHRSMRNVPNTYIFSLAIADLLVIIICVPLASFLYTIEYWPFGVTLCRITEFAKDVSIAVSVFTLTALSAERYYAIVNPLRRMTVMTKSLAVITATVIWILAVLCATPALIISDLELIVLNNNTNYSIEVCSPFGANPSTYKTYAKYNVVTKSIIYYFLPLSIIGVLYALMAHRLHRSAQQMPGELIGPQSRAQARARKHVARMVVTFIIVFIICFLPHHVFMLWFHLHPTSEDDFNTSWHILRIIGFCLSFLNSCANPVALYCVSAVFRQHFHRYLCCKPILLPNRLGMSVGGAGDTSFMSTIRRTNTNAMSNGMGNGSGGNGIGNGSPTQSVILNDKSSSLDMYISDED